MGGWEWWGGGARVGGGMWPGQHFYNLKYTISVAENQALFLLVSRINKLWLNWVYLGHKTLWYHGLAKFSAKRNHAYSETCFEKNSEINVWINQVSMHANELNTRQCLDLLIGEQDDKKSYLFSGIVEKAKHARCKYIWKWYAMGGCNMQGRRKMRNYS